MMARPGFGKVRLGRVGAAAAVAALVLGGAAACGDDEGDEETTDESAESSTTTEAEEKDGSQDEKSDEEESEDEDTKGTSTTARGGGTSTTEKDSSDTTEEASGADPWTVSAVQYRGQDGEQVTIECSEDGAIGSVWGTDTYTDDSSICTAAVHMGLITVEDGGEVTVEITPGEDSYEGSERNGVTSSDYGAWSGSYVFVED
ncbi:MAG: LCCL domain-containing protein [Acidimicrobiales bacterium]|jgi:hypothetical protein|nr:LCCL domain-containing protein [Acidimicrobiales bacterium]